MEFLTTSGALEQCFNVHRVLLGTHKHAGGTLYLPVDCKGQNCTCVASTTSLQDQHRAEGDFGHSCRSLGVHWPKKTLSPYTLITKEMAVTRWIKFSEHHKHPTWLPSQSDACNIYLLSIFCWTELFIYRMSRVNNQSDVLMMYMSPCRLIC